MTKHRDITSKLAICINTDDPDLLTPRRSGSGFGYLFFSSIS